MLGLCLLNASTARMGLVSALQTGSLCLLNALPIDQNGNLRHAPISLLASLFCSAG